MNQLQQAFPVFGLRLISEDVLLRLPRDEEIVALAEQAFGNILDQGQEHFLSGPTGKWESPEEAKISMLRFHWQARANIRPGGWRLVFFIFPLGQTEPVGVIDLSTEKFEATKTVTTGSWILSDRQGQGIGMSARRAALQFAFDHLGASRAESFAVPDNIASNRVSEKLGYERTGQGSKIYWRLKREDFAAFVDLAVIGLQGCQHLLGTSINP